MHSPTNTQNTLFASIMIEERAEYPDQIVYIQFNNQILTAKIDFFKNIFQKEVDAKNIKLVLDFELIDILYSVHLGHLMAAWQKFKKLGGEIKVCSLQDSVEAIFERFGMLKRIAHYSTPQEAIGNFS